MSLKVVWKNQLPLIRAKPTLRRIRNGHFGAVYAVTAQDFMREFELILGDVP
jgi:hypothetical protein